MGYGDTNGTTFEEQVEEDDDESVELRDVVVGGGTCPEDHCDRELFELHHPRDSQLGADAHPDAPEMEVVCLEDGVIRSV